MVFGKLIRNAIARKAGGYSGTATLAKGAQPVIDIGVIVGIAVAVCKMLGLDVNEKLFGEIVTGGIAVHSLLLMLRNYIKNKNKK